MNSRVWIWAELESHHQLKLNYICVICAATLKNEAVKLQRDLMEKTETDRKEASLANSCHLCLKLNINWVWQL